MNIPTFLVLLSLGIFQPLHASLYTYPESKRPAVALKDACGIGEVILTKLGMAKDYYVIGVTILGDKEQSGDGAWTLAYRNVAGEEIFISIDLQENFCSVQNPKEESPRFYTREGNIIEPLTEDSKNSKTQKKIDPFAPSESE